MQFPRCLAALTLGFCAALVSAQEFPTKPVRLIVPNEPGGGTDVLARLFAPYLQETWKQSVIVEYKPGAGTVLGTDYVAKSAPDGYTIGMIATALVINPSLRSNMPFDTAKDLSGVTMNSAAHLVLLVTPSLPVNSIADVIALAKKQPGALNYASAGTGSSMHLAGELLKVLGHIDMVHVPYKGGGPAMLDVMSGRVPFMFNPLYASIPYMKSGKLRPIAVASPQRAAGFPDIPAIAETLPGFDVRSWNGMVVPSATPRAVVKKLNADVVALLRRPDFGAKLAAMGLEPVGTTPEQFDATIRSEIEKWAPIVKASGAKAD
jgi:tripartite-type tricarboxylate transporter receptor subunit TctC